MEQFNFSSPLSATHTLFPSQNLVTSSSSLTPTSTAPVLVSPSTYMAVPPRSLFNLTPAPRSAPASLFSLGAPSTALSPFTSSLPSPASLSSVSENASNSQNFFTPKSPNPEPSLMPSSPSAPRSIPLQQRQTMITPSPFKTQAMSGGRSVVAESPASTDSGGSTESVTDEQVVRVLEFDTSTAAASERNKGKRSHFEIYETESPPASKRATPAPPQIPISPIQVIPNAYPIDSTTTTGTTQSAIQTNNFSAANMHPIPRHQAVKTPSLPSAPMFRAPSTIPTPRAPQEMPPSAIPAQPSEQNVITVRTLSSGTGAYSSYNAALAAQALLEDTDIDLQAPEHAREAYLLESGKMASALEDLVGSVTETSEQIHQLNLHLQMATNEMLLMNASLLVDERFASLNAFFSSLS